MKDANTIAKVVITLSWLVAVVGLFVCEAQRGEQTQSAPAPAPAPTLPAPAPPADQQWRFNNGWTATTRVITLSTGERVLITHTGYGVSTLLLPPEPPPAVESPAAKP